MKKNKQYKQQLPIIIQKQEDHLRETKGSYMYDHSLSVERGRQYQSKNKISIRSSSNRQKQQNGEQTFLCGLIPSSKNIKYQKSKFTLNTEEINKHNQKLQVDVQLLYQLIIQDQFKLNKYQIPKQILTKLNQSKLIDSIQKDHNNLSYNQQNLEHCQLCTRSCYGKIVQTNCLHFYHYDCFQSYLELCVKKGYPQIYCHCKAKIAQQIVLHNTNQLITHRYFQNQYQKIQIKYFKYHNFEKCVNSFCNFFWIKTNQSSKRKTSILQYCPVCLNKNFEIGIQMEQIFQKF
ncbi:unnamed protein product [Paramecium octaurelia]|uniref:RING-type domain-containing protein n=1 Tax=Paramecium octaurelia TaxID=43137 RepID=A0A8S1VNK6_PAROT|nr:unnamed protein product [Paramecium octaurelia]